MTAYLLNLGFNWYGATLGSVWGSSTGYYFLQNALENDNGKPVLFTHFATKDVLGIQIYDLSSSNPWPSGTSPQFTLALAFSDLTSPTTIDPATVVGVAGYSSNTNTVTGSNRYYLQYSSTLTVSPTPSPPWGDAQGKGTAVSLPFYNTSDVRCKLSLLLEVTDPTDSDNHKTFISDTEIIVSSTPKP